MTTMISVRVSWPRPTATRATVILREPLVGTRKLRSHTLSAAIGIIIFVLSYIATITISSSSRSVELWNRRDDDGSEWYFYNNIVLYYYRPAGGYSCGSQKGKNLWWKIKTTTIGPEGARGNNNFVVVAASAYKSTADAFRVGSLARRARRVRPPLFNGHARRPAVGQWRERHRLAITRGWSVIITIPKNNTI